jgi:hypothetical protein
MMIELRGLEGWKGLWSWPILRLCSRSEILGNHDKPQSYFMLLLPEVSSEVYHVLLGRKSAVREVYVCDRGTRFTTC